MPTTLSCPGYFRIRAKVGIHPRVAPLAVLALTPVLGGCFLLFPPDLPPLTPVTLTVTYAGNASPARTLAALRPHVRWQRFARC